MFEMKNQELFFSQIKSLLHHNVPRFIHHIKQRGGVSEQEWQWLTTEGDSPDYPHFMLDRADEYLLHPKEKDIFDKAFFVLVKALAIMSFVAGGIFFFGMHFSSELKGFVKISESET